MNIEKMLSQWKLCMSDTVLLNLTMVMKREIEKVIDECSEIWINTESERVRGIKANELKERLGIKIEKEREQIQNLKKVEKIPHSEFYVRLDNSAYPAGEQEDIINKMIDRINELTVEVMELKEKNK